jgi:hypothetical protein
MMPHDTLYVVSRVIGGGRDYAPLVTGLLGGVIGVAGTYLASRNARRIAQDQIIAQRDIAASQLKRQSESAERQLQATLVVADRVRWIEDLEEHISAFVAGAMALATELMGSVVDSIRVAQAVDRINEQHAAVTLLLDHDEQQCADLTSEMEATTAALTSLVKTGAKEEDVDRIEQGVKKVSALARLVLKEERRRVRRLE